MKKSKLFLGLTAVGVFLTTTLSYGTQLAVVKKGIINDVLGLSGSNLGNSKRSDYAEADGSLSDKGWAKMIADSYDFCVKEEEQGAVLFKNENNALPLAKEERNVTLFGSGGAHLMLRSGAGGAAPNEKIVVHLDDAFKATGFKINQKVWDLYAGNSESTVSKINESPITDYDKPGIKDSFAEYGDVAIVTFARFGTEDSDPSDGILDLQQREKELLAMVKDYKDQGVFKKIVVLLNSPNSMGVDFANKEEYGIDAVLWFGVPGYYSLTGVCNILRGYDDAGNVVNPSGHAPDTFANFSKSSAAYQNFGNFSAGSNKYVVYKEGIYVGYKYYETRYEDCVLGRGNADAAVGVYAGTDSWNYAAEMGYPYGFGLSYTTFEQKIKKAEYNEKTDQWEITVSVKNTGNMEGRASVQIYAQTPYTDYDKETGIEKSAIQLAGYNKVLVKPGKTAEVSVKFDQYLLASYDYFDKKSYILEDGDYYFALGNGAHEALNNIIAQKDSSAALSLIDHNGESYTANPDGAIKKTIRGYLDAYKMSHYDKTVEVTNKFDNADLNYWKPEGDSQHITYLTRQDWEGTFPTKMTSLSFTSEMSKEVNSNRHKVDPDQTDYYKLGEGKNYAVQLTRPNEETGEEENYTLKFLDMAGVPLHGSYTDKNGETKDADAQWEKFISQMSLSDLAISVSDNRGIQAVKRVLKVSNSIAEGPEGLLSQFNYGDKKDHAWATGFATGPVFSATWDHEMQAKFGYFYGEEALHCGVACVNAPGANINRTPYGSRASEYMSEDGVMNYYIASNVVGAARKKGLIMNIKHCFLNNQETNRHGVCTFSNEQAIREIYLKPFEGALTTGEGMGIMTSYNRIGCTYAAIHSDLMYGVMRGEWKYEGLIIDDAQTGTNTDSYANGPMMLEAGTNIFCLDGGRGGQLIDYIGKNNDGALLKKLQESNKYIMYALLQSFMGDEEAEEMSDEELEKLIYEQDHPWWLGAANGICLGSLILTGLVGLAYVAFEVLERKKFLGA